MNYYTVYRDDKIVAFGNAIQCTEKLQLKNIRQFHALISMARSGLRQHYNYGVEKVNEEMGLIILIFLQEEKLLRP